MQDIAAVASRVANRAALGLNDNLQARGFPEELWRGSYLHLRI